MPERVVYREERVDDERHVKVIVQDGDTLVSIYAQAKGDSAEVSQINQSDTTVITRDGLDLLSYGFSELEDRGLEPDALAFLKPNPLMNRIEVEDTNSKPEPEPDETAEQESETEDSTDEENESDELDDPVQDDDAQEDGNDNLSGKEQMLVLLDEQSWMTAEDLADETGLTKGTIYGHLSTLSDQDRIEKRQLDGAVQQKEYRLAGSAEFWCGLCGYGPMGSNHSILTHHGREHGDPDPKIVEEEPEAPIADDGYWCGRCGDGPWETALELEDHHETKHGQGDPIALEEEPTEADLKEPANGVQTWSGKTVADGGSE
ncbi:MAG: ArsR family transcriptional regulator [Halodesulfurarchaeum sp.]